MNTNKLVCNAALYMFCQLLIVIRKKKEGDVQWVKRNYTYKNKRIGLTLKLGSRKATLRSPPPRSKQQQQRSYNQINSDKHQQRQQ